MSELNITPSQDITAGDGFYQEGTTILSPLQWSTATNRRSIGIIFPIPAGFDANSTVSLAELRFRTNNASSINPFEASIMIGDSPNFSNTTDVETGVPNYRLSSVLNTGTPTQLAGPFAASTNYVFPLTAADIKAAVQANPNHSVSGTNLAIVIVPATLGGGQVAGQWISSEHGTAAWRPTLHVEYTSTAFVAKDPADFSKSFGYARFGPEPECWGRWHGDSPEVGGKDPVTPMSSTGSGDLPPTNMYGTGFVNPNTQAWFIWEGGLLQPDGSRIRFSNDNAIYAHKPRPLGHYGIWHEAYDNNSAFTQWNTSYWRSVDGPLSTASLRFTLSWSGLPSNGFPEANVIKAYYQGSVVWEIRLRSFTFTNDSHQVIMRQFVGGTTTTGWSSNRWLYGTPRRIEMQVSNEADTYQLQARCYWNDTEYVTENVLNLACPDVTFDTVEFGTERSPFTGLVNVHLDDVDLWDDYYLGGYWHREKNIGTIQQYGEWDVFEYDGTDFNQVDFAGRVQTESPTALEAGYDFDLLSDYEGERWNRDGATGTDVDPLPYTYHAVNYSTTGTIGLQTMDLYVPTGTPPAEGWPLFTYLHGGFFVSGGRYQMPIGLATWLTTNGWACASLDIRLSSITPFANRVAEVSPQSYPAWNPAQNTARHPTQILDYKQAVEFMQRDAQKTTYNLSGVVVVGGHSAGGYPAMMAMVTKDVADDGNGLSYRVQDHNGTYGFPVIDDPEIHGVYVWSPPADFEVMMDFDFTRRLDWPHANTGNYTMGTTVQLYWGMNFGVQPNQAQLDGSSVPKLIETVPIGNLKPMVYAGGRSDHLVPSDSHYQKYGWDQAKLIEDAYATRGLSSLFEARRHAEVQHYQTPYRRDDVHLLQFLESVRTNL